jgi:acetyl-CoA acetyltransferase family protein
VLCLRYFAAQSGIDTDYILCIYFKDECAVTDVVIVSAVRTPIGKIRGALSHVRPDDMAALVIREAVNRANIDPHLIEEVYMGCHNQAGEDNRNVARMALLLAGLPHTIGGVTINRLCASGLNAVNQAARAIKCGEGDIFVAGGVESMTRAPYAFPKNSIPFGPSGNIIGYDTTFGWRFPNPKMREMFPLEEMGETAENIYERSCAGEIAGGVISREEQDRFALQSQQRAINAINNGWFKPEIVPVTIPQQKGDPVVVDTDENPFYRKTDNGYEVATSMEKLSKLRPVFREGGTVTAGNSSSLNDGACALVLMSADKAKELGIKPLARWIGSAATGVDPRVMGLGPIQAARKVLERNNMTVDDLDLVELNEAFAVQSIAVLRELGISEDITNVHGGAIALGHPLGMSGARILTTLIYAMQRLANEGHSMRYGMAMLCVGVGQGEATLIERIDS